MGFWNRIKSLITGNKKASGPVSLKTGNPFPISLSGSTLQTNETVFSVITQLSNAMASMPLKLYKNYEEVTDSDLAMEIKYHPNPSMTSFSFIQKLETDRNEYGNAYVLIERDEYWQPVNLYPVSPTCVTVMQNQDDNSIWYKITATNENILVSEANILHLKHISGSTRLLGISPLDVLKNALDFDLAVQKFSLSEMSKVDSFKVTYGSNVDDESRKDVIDNFRSFIRDNGGVLFEEPGVEISQLPREFLSGDLINTEKITDTRIANAFNVPLAFLNQSTVTNNEDLMSQFVQRTLIPIARQYEQELTNKLLTEQQRKTGMYFKFNVNSLLRGNVQARTAYYQALRRSGILTTNDIRALEDLPQSKDEFADKLFVSGDLYPLDMDPAQRKGVSSNGNGTKDEETNQVLGNEQNSR